MKLHNIAYEDNAPDELMVTLTLDEAALIASLVNGVRGDDQFLRGEQGVTYGITSVLNPIFNGLYEDGVDGHVMGEKPR